jgi:hypothetical protein
LWWAPKLPHSPGKGLTGVFDSEAIYAQHYRKALFNLERVSQFDVAFGALLDELNRSCVCVLEGGVAKKKSLLDNTIVLFLTDHGRFLPRSKGNPTDNNHRTPLIISLPGHRDKSLTPAVYREQMTHSIDVLRTVLSQAKIRYPLNPAKRPTETTVGVETPYPFARDLSPCLHGDATNCSAGSRKVSYGEDSSSAGITKGDTRARYIVLEAPGVCTTKTQQPVHWVGPIGTPAEHAKPCFGNGDCPGGSCDTTTYSKRCVNDPTKRCAITSECIEGLCNGIECVYDTDHPRSFGDRAAPRRTPAPGDFAPCSTNEQCIPCAEADSNGNCTERVELCQPIRLKVEANSKGIQRAWDLNWDPDETRDLLKDAPGNDYLGTTFRGELEKCLASYWELAGSDETWTGGGTTPNSACAWPEPNPGRAPYVPPGS